MSVADRLRAILGPAASQSGAVGARPDLTTPPQPSARETARGESASAKASLDVFGDKTRLEASHVVVEHRVEASQPYGRDTIRGYHHDIHAGLARASMLNAGSGFSAPLVFFDLETTGLNGGAGTLAFLVGCARFDESGTLTIRQYLLTNGAGEAAMLDAVAEEIGGAGCLVSFNGKSFDAPLLEMRYLFQRRRSPLDRSHLDVLHPARRFWRDGGACTLGALERTVLRAGRDADIPGSEIPSRYFQFLRTGDAGLLAAVLEHNRRDLLTLAGLTARLLLLLREGPRAASTAREAAAIGWFYAGSRMDQLASVAYRRALAFERTDAETRVEALRGLAEVRRRERSHDEAAQCWQQLLDLEGCPPRVAHEAARALAVHHEHRVRDLPAARRYAMRSLQTAERLSRTEALHHRLARIERKIEARTASAGDGLGLL